MRSESRFPKLYNSFYKTFCVNIEHKSFLHPKTAFTAVKRTLCVVFKDVKVSPTNS